MNFLWGDWELERKCTVVDEECNDAEVASLF